MRSRCSLIALALMLMLAGCSGNRQVSLAPDLQTAREQYDTAGSIKVFRKDGMIALFRKKVVLTKDSIKGNAELLFPDGRRRDTVGIIIPAMDIAAATIYDVRPSPSSTAGAVFTTVVGGFLWITTVVCLSDPKSCFGSCPTVYVPVGDSMEMVAELFSTSISPSLARDDLDRLTTLTSAEPMPVRITNEALETHVIDRLEFIVVPHGHDERVLPAGDGRIRFVGTSTLSLLHASAQDTSIRARIVDADTEAWRSGPERLRTLPPSAPFDEIDLMLNAAGHDSIDLEVRWRNTLLTTVLLYDIVLGDQGLKALAWQNWLDTDPLYARAFEVLYERYSGIRIHVWSGTEWVEVEHLRDAGPIVWRDEVRAIPTFGQDTLRVRLSCLADNVLLDRVRATVPVTRSIQPYVASWEVVQTTAVPQDSIRSAVAFADGAALIHDPGSLTEILVTPPTAMEYGTLLVRSRGFYYEWIRSSWLARPTLITPEALLAGDAMIERLTDRWMRVHVDIESDFQRTTFPLRRP